MVLAYLQESASAASTTRQCSVCLQACLRDAGDQCVVRYTSRPGFGHLPQVWPPCLCPRAARLKQQLCRGRLSALTPITALVPLQETNWIRPTNTWTPGQASRLHTDCSGEHDGPYAETCRDGNMSLALSNGASRRVLPSPLRVGRLCLESLDFLISFSTGCSEGCSVALIRAPVHQPCLRQRRLRTRRTLGRWSA